MDKTNNNALEIPEILGSLEQSENEIVDFLIANREELERYAKIYLYYCKNQPECAVDIVGRYTNDVLKSDKKILSVKKNERINYAKGGVFNKTQDYIKKCQVCSINFSSTEENSHYTENQYNPIEKMNNEILVGEILSLLDSDEIELIELRCYRQYQFDQIGLIMGIESATARQRWKRLLIKIRGILEN